MHSVPASQKATRIDKAAKKAAIGSQPGVDFGFRGGKVGRARGSIKGAASLFPARGQSEVVCPYRSVVVGKIENKIRFVVYSEDKQQFVEKFYAYASPEIGAHLHRGHAYRVRFGHNPKYPVIEEIIEELDVPASTGSGMRQNFSPSS